MSLSFSDNYDTEYNQVFHNLRFRFRYIGSDKNSTLKSVVRELVEVMSECIIEIRYRSFIRFNKIHRGLFREHKELRSELKERWIFQKEQISDFKDTCLRICQGCDHALGRFVDGLHNGEGHLQLLYKETLRRLIPLNKCVCSKCKQ
jgi:hypothetical protein